jgi:ABC-type transport system substrate-binding protein
MKARILFALIASIVTVLAVACSGAASPTPAPTSAPEPTAPTGPGSTPIPTAEVSPTTEPAPTPTSSAGPQGEISIAVVDVGPPQYYGYQLTWPYNERNLGLGLYDALIWFDGVTLQSQVVSSWELDGNRLIMNIQEGIPFHDSQYGNVTADDVVHTYANTTKEGTLMTAASTVIRDYTGFSVVDEDTVEFTLVKPVVTWPVGMRTFGIESKQMFEERGEEYMLLNENGTGPFRLVSHTADDQITLEAVMNHWRQTPHVNTINVLEVPEPSSRVAMLQTGEADAIQIDLPFVPQVENEEGVQIIEGRYGAGTGTSVFFAGQYYRDTHPQTGEPVERTLRSDLQWVGDPNDAASMQSARMVRKAFNYAIDREGIIDTILNGHGCAQYQYRVDACANIWDDKWATPYNPDMSRQLLAEAGYPSGFDFDFFIPSGTNTTMEEIAESIVPMWEDVGLRASIDKTAYSARRPTMVDRTIDDVWMFIHGSVVTPDGLVQQWHELGGLGVWNMGAEIPRATELADAVLSEPEWESAWQKVAEGLDWFAEEQPVGQAVTWRDPYAIGGSLESWDMPTHPGTFPVYLENIVPAQ